MKRYLDVVRQLECWSGQMNTPIEIVNPITFPNWDELLLSTPGYSFFHTSTWARVLSESYGFAPLYFTIIENGRLRTLVPVMEVKSILTGKRGVSLPFTDYCEPIIDNEFSFQEMLDNILTYGKQKGWKYLELRGGGHLLSGVQPCANYLWHTLDLKRSSDAIFRTFRKGTKSAIKKAEKEPFEIRVGRSEDSIIEFYRLNCVTRKYHGLPPQPQSFFRATYRHILKQGLGMVILASYRGTDIAGSVFFHFGDKAVYKYGASRREFQDLRANNLIIWKAINYCLEKGCTHFCFGRTERENEGLRIFKNGWGTQEHAMNYYKYDLGQARFIPGQNRVSKFQNMVFGKMPIPLLKIIGTVGYKHVG
jgi:hypothetical protein